MMPIYVFSNYDNNDAKIRSSDRPIDLVNIRHCSK